MPKVTLISYTGHGHPDPLYAARLLAFTKQTRLQMDPGGFAAFMARPAEDILKELDYMAGTIPSSWEFADVTFLISEVSRATAQQITRTRFTPIDGDIFGSYAMQSQRVTDMSGVTWDPKPGEGDEPDEWFEDRMRLSLDAYALAVARGNTLEDARDLLPMGVHCNLVAKYNFRNFVEMCSARESIRVQGPFREVTRQMKEQVLAVWPWAAAFFVPKQDRALAMLQEVASELAEAGAVYKGPAGKIAKAIDLIKKG